VSSSWAYTIRKLESDYGYKLIDEAPWLNRNEWEEIVVSTDKEGRIRLVLLDAKEPKTGAFTRLLEGIYKAGLTPVIVEPIGFLEEWCRQHGWRSRRLRHGSDQQKVWYKRPM
jgi:hypothetical protein